MPASIRGALHSKKKTNECNVSKYDQLNTEARFNREQSQIVPLRELERRKEVESDDAIEHSVSKQRALFLNCRVCTKPSLKLSRGRQDVLRRNRLGGNRSIDRQSAQLVNGGRV